MIHLPPRSWAELVRIPFPQRLHKLLILLALLPILIVSSSSPFLSTVASNEIQDSHYEVTRTVEPQVLARLESQFLKAFGMKTRPKKSEKTIKVPKYLVDLYETQSGSKLKTTNLNLPGRHTRTANTVRTFYHLREPEVGWGHRLNFDLGSIPDSEELTGAELRLVFNRKETEVLKERNLPHVRVLVNDVIKPPRTKPDAPSPDPIMYPIDSKLVKLKGANSSLWLTLDVFPAVLRWKREPKRNHGLVIQIIHPDGQVINEAATRHVRIRRDLSSNSHEGDPVLFTYSDDGRQRKQRNAQTLSRHFRAANNKGGREGGKRKRGHRNKNRKRNLCSKHRMFVDFNDVGWNDWIVAPPGYEAFHCAGECPFPMADHLNATNHAVIQALVNSMNPQLVPPPCCVPTKYSSVSLLYNDSSDKVVLKNYNEMVVDACGCS